MPRVKSLTPKKNDGKAVKVTTPSPYGSHASMLVNEKGNGMVELQDDVGRYVTESWRLDNGQADPNRNSGRDVPALEPSDDQTSA